MQYLPFDVEKLLSKLLSKELKYAEQLEKLKQQLAVHPDYNLERLFNEIDKKRTNYIDVVNLKSFLIRCSYLPNDNLLLAIIRRVDLDGDARINFREFIDALRPLENYINLLERTRSKRIELERKKSLGTV
jgi:Ca2+-binding EF-hand superfamily protein